MKRGEEPGRGQRGSSEHQLLSSACCMSGACTGPEASGRVASPDRNTSSACCMSGACIGPEASGWVASPDRHTSE